MITDDEDEELRSAFAALRDEDASHAPSFQALRRRVETRSSRSPASRRIQPRTWILVAAAAAVVAAVSVVAARDHRFRTAPDDAARLRDAGVAPSIAAWRSPTQGLLRLSGGELLSTPSVYSSVLADAPRPSAQRKGD